MKKSLLFVFAAALVFILTACIRPINEVESIEISNWTAEERYELTAEPISLAGVELTVTYDDGETAILSLESNEISLIGNGITASGDALATNTVGEKTLRISYGGVSYTVYFEVVKHLIEEGDDIQVKIDDSGTLTGETIYFSPGHYHTDSPIVISKEISLVGPNIGTATITRDRVAGENVLLQITSDNVTVSNLTMNLGLGSQVLTESDFIQVSGDNVTIEDNVIHGSYGTFTKDTWPMNGVVLLTGSATATVENNEIFNFGNGMIIEAGSSFTLIENNEFTFNRVQVDVRIDPVTTELVDILSDNIFPDERAEIVGSLIRDVAVMLVASVHGDETKFDIQNDGWQLQFNPAETAAADGWYWFENNGSPANMLATTASADGPENTQIGGVNQGLVDPYYGKDANPLRAGVKTYALSDVAAGYRLDEISLEFTYINTIGAAPGINFWMTDDQGHYGIFAPQSGGMAAVSSTTDNGDGTTTVLVDLTDPTVSPSATVAVYEHNGLVDFYGDVYTTMTWDTIKHFNLSGPYDYQRGPTFGWEAWGSVFNPVINADNPEQQNNYGIALFHGDTSGTGAAYATTKAINSVIISVLGMEYVVRFESSQLIPGT